MAAGLQLDRRATRPEDPLRRQTPRLTQQPTAQASHTEARTVSSKTGIERRLVNGSLVRRYWGVYVIPPLRQDPQALLHAAVLAGGPTAVASHGSAAWLWGLLPHYEPPPHISLPTGDRRPRHIRSHRCPSLLPRDVTRQLGVPTTTPARTILDLAPHLGRTQLTRLVNDQLRAKLLRQTAPQDILNRNPLHPATKLPTPEIGFPLTGRKLDAFFPEHGVIVECDGWAFHKDTQAFEDDRERDADHLDHGLVTVRLTQQRFRDQPDHEAARLHRITRQNRGYWLSRTLS